MVAGIYYLDGKISPNWHMTEYAEHPLNWNFIKS